MSREHADQQAVVAWLRLAHPKVLFCASLGGVNLGARRGAVMRAMGYQAGFPDLAIFEPRGAFHGLFVEMKAEKGRISEAQDDFHELLAERGYAVSVCYGVDAAKDEILMYLCGQRASAWRRLR